MSPRYGTSASDIKKIARILADGGVAAVPTETVYGLAADALNETACRRLFEIKERPFEDPLIVHVHDLEGARRLARFHPVAEVLADRFWPGPLTLVLKKDPRLPGIVTANLDTVAIRVPDHPVMRHLLRISGLALAAPSANPFGYLSPTRAEHVASSLGDRVEHILDGGPCRIGLESTVLALHTTDTPTVLRRGAVTEEMLSEILGRPVAVASPAVGPPPGPMRSPGSMGRHYSPRARLHLLEPLEPTASPSPGGSRKGKTTGGGRAAVVRLKPTRPPEGADLGQQAWFTLTEDGHLPTAARNLFHLLRQIDEAGFTDIYIETAPETDLGRAFNERLRRAAGRP